jgi:hypothetical protein
MQKSTTLWLCFALILSAYFLHPLPAASAQSVSTPNIASGTKPLHQVKVSATANVDVSNSTLDAKDKMLRTAVTGFLTFGPNVLKANPSDQPVVKTKIFNKLTNTTQTVEGIEATNAVIAVEITKALEGSIASSVKANQSSIVTLETTSTCNPINLEISCENSVSIK